MPSWEQLRMECSRNHTRKREQELTTVMRAGNSKSLKRKYSSEIGKWPNRVEKAETQRLKRWILTRNKMIHSWSTEACKQKVLCKVGKGLRHWKQIGWCFMCRMIRGTGPHSTKAIAPPIHLQEWGIYSLRNCARKALAQGHQAQTRLSKVAAHMPKSESSSHIHPSRLGWWSARQGRRLRTTDLGIPHCDIWPHTQLYCLLLSWSGISRHLGKVSTSSKKTHKKTPPSIHIEKNESESKRNKAGGGKKDVKKLKLLSLEKIKY